MLNVSIRILVGWLLAEVSISTNTLHTDEYEVSKKAFKSMHFLQAFRLYR